MSVTDLYAVLEVSRDATADEVKSAYRHLARKYHPDVNPDNPEAEEKFKEVSQAYAVLSDDEKRAHYDQFGSVDVAQGQDFSARVDFSDLFEAFLGGFGGGAHAEHRPPGRGGHALRSVPRTAHRLLPLALQHDDGLVPPRRRRAHAVAAPSPARAEPVSLPEVGRLRGRLVWQERPAVTGVLRGQRLLVREPAREGPVAQRHPLRVGRSALLQLHRRAVRDAGRPQRPRQRPRSPRLPEQPALGAVHGLPAAAVPAPHLPRAGAVPLYVRARGDS
ncbi:MAG: J domain-containing protein [Armatimonadetes bacterium]|nr:J domain-containing protein [Armatimonadota bacterium]